jgi:hypothetical protein
MKILAVIIKPWAEDIEQREQELEKRKQRLKERGIL